MTLSIDLYVSFRSPYSFFIAGRLRRLAEAHELAVILCPVLPLILRYPSFLSGQLSLAHSYFDIDVARTAERLGLPYTPENCPDPIVVDETGLGAAPEQPYINRLTRLGVAAEERGHGLTFFEEFGTLLWSGERWLEGDRLARAATRAGLDLAEMDAAIERDAGRYETLVNGNGRSLEMAGHWGTPTCVFDGEPFFGQDRYDLLAWRLERSGLKLRVG
jgi:2-hydroxychromene-2-carboxylate isomerase